MTKRASGNLVPLSHQTKFSQRAKSGDEISRDLVKEIALDVGKSLAAYVEVMFPEIWHGSNSGFKISLRNHVYNDIVSISDLHDEAAIKKRLADNDAHRKKWVGAYRKMRRKKCKHGIQEQQCGLCDDENRGLANRIK